MEKKLLPIGSVVLLKNAKISLMITGFYMLDEKDQNKMYDYCGCIHPVGVLKSDRNFLFNHEDIEEIYFIGFSNDKEKLYRKSAAEFVDKVKNGNDLAMPKLNTEEKIEELEGK